VDEYAGEAGCIPGLLSMLQHFITPTYALFTRPDGLRNNPGTVDDFFRLNARFMQRAPLHYLQVRVQILDNNLFSPLFGIRIWIGSGFRLFSWIRIQAGQSCPQKTKKLRNAMFEEFSVGLKATLEARVSFVEV
jgi:hypothetical protein